MTDKQTYLYVCAMSQTQETTQDEPAVARRLSYRDKMQLALEFGATQKTIDKAVSGVHSQNKRTQEIRRELIRRGVAENVTSDERAQVATAAEALS